jgi:hypothetical protein
MTAHAHYPSHRRSPRTATWSDTELLAAVARCVPREVATGRSHMQLPGVTIVDVARALGTTPEYIRAGMAALVAARRLTVQKVAMYQCYSLPNPERAA